MDTAEEGRARRSAAERIDQILDVAERLVLEVGGLPVPMKRVGELTGASRGLVYAYFPDPDHLARAVLERQVARLEAAGLRAATEGDDFAAAAQAACVVYLQHVAQYGPLVSILVRDLGSRRGTEGPVQRALGRLARTARRDLALTPHEAVVALELVAAIPEEAGRLVFSGELALQDALALCERLVASSIDALRVNADDAPVLA